MKNLSLTRKVAYSLLCGMSTLSGLSAAETATASPITTSAPSIINSSSTTQTEIAPKPFVKHIVSKLADISDEKKNPHIETPLGSAAFSLYNKLSFSSAKTESTLKKLNDFLTSKETAGEPHVDTTKARFSYELAKTSLENANTSLSLMSTLLEKWVNETSTTTFKKAVGMKKADFRNQAEAAKTNLKTANEAIKASVAAYKAAEKDFTTQTTSSSTTVVTQKDQTIFDLASSSQAKSDPQTILPLSEVTKTLKQ